MHSFLLRATLVALAAAPWAAGAEPAYPSRPITLIVPFAAGGGTDSIARDIAKNLGTRLGQTVVVENRGGAGGAIGATAVAKAAADGHTLLFATSTFITNAAVEAKLPYDPLKDFAPVAMIGRGPLLLVASHQLGATSMAQLIEAGKARPQGLNYCSAGNGSINHLAGEMFRQRTALELTHVPFKGSGPATVELLAGRIDLLFATVPTILSQVREGKLPLLAVTGEHRSPLFPDTPTVSEAGLPGFEAGTWWGVLAPGKTPKPIIDALNHAVNEAAATAPIPSRMEHEGASAVRLTPEAFGEELQKELTLWRGIAAQSGLAQP